MVLPFLPALRNVQNNLMTDRIQVRRNGVLVYTDVPARTVASRLFAEPGDPHDANLRSTQEVGFTIPYTYTGVRVSDVIEQVDENNAITLSVIAGEVMGGDTWSTAVRIWGTKPKTATPTVAITLYRYSSGTDDYELFGTFDVQLVFDRVQPTETPLRYSPAGHASYQGGVLIGDLTFVPQIEDRFTLDGYGCIIDNVLPQQPQHVEAHFLMNISGTH